VATPVSAKLFAEFVLGGPAKKASTVRKLLKPRSPEARIPTGYYRRAVGIIRGYHERGNDSEFVAQGIKQLQKDAETAATPQARTMRLNNLRAVELYIERFSDRRWRVTSCPRIYYTSCEIRISGSPDLAISDEGRMRLIKLGVRKKKETAQMVRLMLRVMYQAAGGRIGITTRDVTYFDVRTGEVVSGDPADGGLARSIDDGCQLLRDWLAGRAP
jgi:hypothetical protein